MLMVGRGMSIDYNKGVKELEGLLMYYGSKCTMKVLLSLKSHIVAQPTSVSRQGFRKNKYDESEDLVPREEPKKGTRYHEKTKEGWSRKLHSGEIAIPSKYSVAYVAMEDSTRYYNVVSNLHQTRYVPFEPTLMPAHY